MSSDTQLSGVAQQAQVDAIAQRLRELSVTPLLNSKDPALTQRRPDPAKILRWKDIRSGLDELAKLPVDGEFIDRRILHFGPPEITTTTTLGASIQMLMPGEVAPTHSHNYMALRFILEGSRVNAVVDGRRVQMSPGDLILTPSWAFHGHDSPDDNDPVIWMDAGDYTFIKHLDAAVFEKFRGEGYQEVVTGDAEPLWQIGTAGMLSGRYRERPLSSPQLVYPWSETERILKRALEAGTPDPIDGLVYEYVNPITGGHCFPTVSCFAQALPAGFSTQTHRRTSSNICLVVEGSGSLTTDDTHFEWEKHDIFAIPGSCWHHLTAERDSFLFILSDQSILEAFGLDRVETEDSFRGDRAR